MRWTALPDRYVVTSSSAGLRSAVASESSTGSTSGGTGQAGAEQTGRRAQSRDAKAVQRKERPFRLKRQEPTEQQVLNAILARLARHPNVVFVHRMNSGATKTATGGFIRFGFTGCPDIVAGLKDGRTAWIEVKRPSGRVSDAQAAFIEECRAHGIPAGIARSQEDAVQIVEAA